MQARKQSIKPGDLFVTERNFSEDGVHTFTTSGGVLT
jgi:hypothetical protein